MAQRFLICSGCLRRLKHKPFSTSTIRTLATASAITPSPSPTDMASSISPIARYPLTQPPSHKSPELRNAQLIRIYTSLLQSTPLLIFFQHNNLNRTEWIYVRRELFKALQKVDAQESTDLANSIKIQVIQNRMFEFALAVVEHFQPSLEAASTSSSVHKPHATDPRTSTSFDQLPNAKPIPEDPIFTHALSTAARNVARRQKGNLSLSPVLCGPVAALVLPTISPAHLKAALSILAPEKPLYPPPTRRANPTYHNPITQAGIQKLTLLGARLDGNVFGAEEPRRIGLIEGGLEGLRAQVVALLNGAAGGLVGVLERSRTGVWMTLEGRRAMMEEEETKAKDGVDGRSASASASGEGKEVEKEGTKET